MKKDKNDNGDCSSVPLESVIGTSTDKPKDDDRRFVTGSNMTVDEMTSAETAWERH